MALSWLDLNNGTLEDHETGGIYEFVDNSSVTDTISVYFRGLESHLIKLISEAEVVVGCVAWLTSEAIINALAETKCAIVVQKEDFLRPDIGSNGNWNRRLRKLYDRLKSPSERYYLGDLVGMLSVGGDPAAPPVRCVGNYNKDKSPAFPRMHNKFLVFCEWGTITKGTGERWEYTQSILSPHTVWTGSFNFTKNAALSLENAIVIKDTKIAKAYFDEWQQIYAMSESLDWESIWSAPEWRIGT